MPSFTSSTSRPKSWESKGKTPPKLQKAFDVFKTGIHFIIPIFFLMYTLIVLRQSPQMAAFNAIIFMRLIMVLQHPISAMIRKEKLTAAVWLAGFSDIGHGMVNGAKNMVPIAVATGVAGIVVRSVTPHRNRPDPLRGDRRDRQRADHCGAPDDSRGLPRTRYGAPHDGQLHRHGRFDAPVIMDLANSLGYVIPAIAAHLFVFYFGILADDTPPVGMAAYAAAGIAKSDPIKTGLQGFAYDIRTAILPFAFFFNNKLLLIEGVDAADSNDPAKWQWIHNPLEIGLIFVAAAAGMFAFSSATQGWFLTKTNALERILLLAVVPFMLAPNIMAAKLGIGSEYLAYGIGFAIYLVVYFLQKARIAKHGHYVHKKTGFN